MCDIRKPSIATPVKASSDVIEMGIVGHRGHRGFEIAGEFRVHVSLE
jgi:hypothetical protein